MRGVDTDSTAFQSDIRINVLFFHFYFYFEHEEVDPFVGDG